MSKQDNGGPAFPCDAIEERNSMGKLQGRAISGPGISIRDYFAAQSISGINPGKLYGDDAIQSVAEQAYRLADAMLEARNK